MNPLDLPLRDIQLPLPVGVWPPAVGWWVLLAAAIAALAGGYVWRRWFRVRHRLIRRARQRLDAIASDYEGHRDSRRLARELSRLARQLAMSLGGRREAASLTGEAWLEYLERWSDAQVFTHGPGRALGDAPYAPPPGPANGAMLLAAFRRWVDGLGRHTLRAGRS